MVALSLHIGLSGDYHIGSARIARRAGAFEKQRPSVRLPPVEGKRSHSAELELVL